MGHAGERRAQAMTLCETLEVARQLPPVCKEGITQLNKNLCYSGEKKTVGPLSRAPSFALFS